MIAKITGVLTEIAPEAARLAVGPIEYEILLPELVRRQLQGKLNEEVCFFTIQYLEGNPAHGRMIPRLLGFLSEIERDFFELFCSVDGVGARKGLKAMTRPVQEIADAIEQQDYRYLATLPGVGAAMAERIVAKLRRRVPQFALMVASKSLPAADPGQRSVLDDAYETLIAVGHSAQDARQLIDTAREAKKKFKDVQEVLTVVYQQSRGE